MKLLVINGPNLNFLGIREPDVYGTLTYAQLCQTIHAAAAQQQIEIDIFQSNHEGAIVDRIQEAYQKVDGIIINPAAYTHTSIAILDALKAVGLPCIEVHLSNIYERESFRHISYPALACIASIAGHGVNGYLEAMEQLQQYIKKERNIED